VAALASRQRAGESDKTAKSEPAPVAPAAEARKPRQPAQAGAGRARLPNSRRACRACRPNSPIRRCTPIGGKRAATLGQQQEALRVQLAAAESELLALYEASVA
jgi:hypothetical protein